MWFHLIHAGSRNRVDQGSAYHDKNERSNRGGKHEGVKLANILTTYCSTVVK